MPAPLTERVLARLPGPQVGWFLAWGLLPFAAYEIAYHAWQLPTYSGLASQLVILFGNVFGLWAAGHLGRRAGQLQPTLERLLTADDLLPRHHPFRHVGSLIGPLAITALFVLSYDVLNFIDFPGFATGFVVVTVFIGLLPVATFVWVYAAALFGLDRIGRRALRLEPFWTDPNLGLKPLGSLAFEGFLLSVVIVAPVFVWAITDIKGLISTVVLVAIVSALFFLSAYTMHRQMVRAKGVQIRWARDLLEAAIGPIQSASSASLDGASIAQALHGQAAGLAAATEIERRALSIQEWPFDTAIIRTVAAILTSVTAVIIARLLLSQLGM